MKFERQDVGSSMWRKKVDSSLFTEGTPIPAWVCAMWGIPSLFSHCVSKTMPESRVPIRFDGLTFDGSVTVAPKGRVTPQYRLWLPTALRYRLKHTFLMSYMRDIEARLRGKRMARDIEEEIPFWEFLDIEFTAESRTFSLTAYYTQKPTFPELFERIVGAPVLDRIDDELNKKTKARIHKQGWKPRSKLKSEIEVENALYTLLDTTNKLVYVGEASKLVRRLEQPHLTINDWNFYRYDVLPPELAEHRVTLERMLIRDLAALFSNSKGVDHAVVVSEYRLTNDRIDD